MRTVLVFTLLAVSACATPRGKQDPIKGGLNPDVIRKILISHIPNFRKCMGKHVLKNPTVGIVKITFTIGPKGKVTESEVFGGKMGLPPKEKECLENAVSRILFPEPVGGGSVEVRQPMNFYPKEVKKKK